MATSLRGYVFIAAFFPLLSIGCAESGSSLPIGSGAVPGSTGGTGTNTSPGLGNGGNAPVGTIGDGKACGTGTLESGEQCDDANKNPGDGCSPICQIEADYVCPTVGQPCINQAVCGNGSLSSAEACDDGNTADGDGCSADCRAITPGYQCRVPGKPCLPACGDGQMIGGERCDDAKPPADGDGCSKNCLIEPGWSCTAAPSTCIQAVCGNSVVDTGEDCDLGAANGLFHGDGTGCSKTCTQEPVCRTAGVTGACVTRCGDGNIDANSGETCDDSNGFDGDGCSGTCQTEAGFTCAPKTVQDAQPCATGTGTCLQLPITYRDFDGAQSTTGHPDFLYMLSTPAGGTRTMCVPNASGRPAGALSGSCPGHDSTPLCLGLTAPTLNATGKPDANATRAGGLTCACQYTDWDKTFQGAGIAETTIAGAGFTLTHCSSGGSGDVWSVKHSAVPVIQSANTFKQWYTDSTSSTKSVGTLELSLVAGSTNTYRFTASNGRTLYDDIHDIWNSKNNQPALPGAVASLTSGFFPLEASAGGHATKLCNLWPYWVTRASCLGDQWDVRGGTGSPPPGATATGVTGVPRNYYFTTEARYLFRFAGGETLIFHGDDDVWVYINGKLVLDMGAPHERLEGTVTLTATGSTATLRSQDAITQAFTTVGTTQTTTGLGLVAGNTYEIAIFHADHHPRDSNYQLTLTGFSRTYSVCGATCGDGTATFGEECDLGTAGNTGLYGGCTADCKYGPYCGDGIPDPEEQCDLGAAANTGAYGVNGCTPGCTKAHFCGDGILDSAFGEECDGGPSPSGACNGSCKIIIQ